MQTIIVFAEIRRGHIAGSDELRKQLIKLVLIFIYINFKTKFSWQLWNYKMSDLYTKKSDVFLIVPRNTSILLHKEFSIIWF